MDANQTAGEETWRQLHKNVESNIEQVLVTTPTRRQLYGHLPPHHEKLYRLDEPDTPDTAGEARTSS